MQKTISHYSILTKLGSGGMGEVYLAEDTRLDRKVALKLLPAASVADENAKRRLVREAKAAAQLDHPNICSIYEVGEEDGRSFIVMQYVDGETLASRIQRSPLELTEALDIAAQAADALSAAHSLGIIHRDIKPQNIMLTARRQVKVLDFGVAKLVHELDFTRTDLPTQSLLSQPGMIIGTVPYMSPEQLRGETIDARSDIFSFGAVFYEMLTGRSPFVAESAAATFSAIMTRQPPPIARYSIESPAELQRILNKTLCKDREERYQTIRDLGIDLRNLKQELEFAAKQQSSVASKRSEGALPSGALATVETLEAAAAGTAGARGAPTTSTAEPLFRAILRHKRAAIIAVVFLAMSAAAFIYLSGNGKAIDSLAVLPFANDDPNTEYLSDGITESLISNLSQLHNFKVKSRSAVFRYKGRDADPQTAGRELGVRAVLIGKMTQRGDGLALSVELVDVQDSNQIWGNQYNRKLSDILKVQDEITTHVTEKLRLPLTGEEQRRLARRSRGNPEAYRLYLEGRYYADRLTQEGFEKAIESINQAIALDPNYALAYDGLARAYFQTIDLFLPPREAVPKCKAALKRALELDDTLAEAHAGLASIHWQYDWDWVAAEKEFKRALELNPQLATAHGDYGFYLAIVGRFDESIAEESRAQELDPLDATAGMLMTVSLYFARRYDQAAERGRRTIQMDPNFWLAHTTLGRAYEQRGQLPDAIAEYQKARQIDNMIAEILMDLGRAYGVAGRRAEAEAVLAELRERSKNSYVAPFHIAMVYIGLGDKDQAFAWLEKAYEARSWYLTWLKVAPELDSLRSDPRFADLMRRVSFTP